MKLELEYRFDLRRLAPNKWRLVGLVGRALFFYGETGAEAPPLNFTNELALADVGKWRAIDGTRRLIVAQGGKGIVQRNPEGGENDLQVTFEGVAMALRVSGPGRLTVTCCRRADVGAQPRGGELPSDHLGITVLPHEYSPLMP